MALTNAEKKVAQRDRARASGICIVCFVNDAAPGKTVCDPCNDDAKERVRASRLRAKKRKKSTPKKRKRKK